MATHRRARAICGLGLVLLVACGMLRGTRALLVDSPCCATLTHVAGEFSDRQVLTSGELSRRELVAVTPLDACAPLRGQNLVDKIALVQRGDCNFVTKVIYAQRAGAVAVVVMDEAARPHAPYHIIMQRDENASLVKIPGVFVSYEDGERLMLHLLHAAPWRPVRVTLDATGELIQHSNKYRLFKRGVAYIFLVSLVCAVSSGLSIVSTYLFGWISKAWRTRVMRTLPVRKYDRTLKQQMRRKRAELLPPSSFAPVTKSVESEALENPTDSDESDCESESCVICLEDFQPGEIVKVLPCLHYYHVQCINPWLETRSGCCPLCNHDAIAASDDTPKSILGLPLPRIEQVLRQERAFHTFFLMLPASLVSCLIVNSAVSIIRNLWP